MEASIASAEAQRPPVAIKLVCLVGLAWWVYLVGANVAIRLFDVPEAVFPTSVPRAGGPTIFQPICLMAMWGMRQWGVLGYIAVAIWYNVIYYIGGAWSWLWLAVSLSVVVVGLAYFRRMR
jgi:hypothetical protein